jgi:RNA-directed DNA polymerase
LDRESKTTSLQRIANKAGREKAHRFGNLYGMLDEAMLYESWAALNKRAAAGVDRIKPKEFEADLAKNIRLIVEDLKAKRYRAPLVRRKNIERPDGKLRPLGIPAVGDKLVQAGAARILEAIYEQDFLECSYGYRKGRSIHEAVKIVDREIAFGGCEWVVEADISGFFNHLDHEWLIRMLRERVADSAFLRLISKWLKAGVLEEDGRIIHPESGTPQGGIVSPVLANVYLHYALDLWFERRIKPKCQGKALLVRYADDFVAVFEKESDARAFYAQLGERLGKFGLSLSEAKTRICRIRKGHDRQGFDFLGFNFRWKRNHRNREVLERRTARKKWQAAVKRLGEWIRSERHRRVGALLRSFEVKVRGHANYYGLPGNRKSVYQYFEAGCYLMFKWLNRRSQRGRYTWEKFARLLKRHGICVPRRGAAGQQLELFCSPCTEAS